MKTRYSLTEEEKRQADDYFNSLLEEERIKEMQKKEDKRKRVVRIMVAFESYMSNPKNGILFVRSNKQGRTEKTYNNITDSSAYRFYSLADSDDIQWDRIATRIAKYAMYVHYSRELSVQ